MNLGDCKIRILNEEHSKAVQTRLFELGYSWSDKKDFKYTKQNSIFVYKSSKTLGYSNIDKISFENDSRKEVTLTNLYEVEKERSMQLTKDYKAYLKDGFVQVGCQKISFEKVEELYNLIYKE